MRNGLLSELHILPQKLCFQCASIQMYDDAYTQIFRVQMKISQQYIFFLFSAISQERSIYVRGGKCI